MTEKETLEKETIEAETNLETDILYDAKANQRYAFEAKSGSDKYDTAHVFTPVDDEKYLEYVNNLNIKGELLTLQYIAVF